MSGILDNKSRILDVILTQEGRRQLASGDMKIEFVTFTDAGTFYEKDLISGSSPTNHRLFLEAASLYHDQITFESNDAGLLNSIDPKYLMKNGNVLSYTLSGSSDQLTILSGQEFSSTSDELLFSSLQNLSKVQALSTVDRIFNDEGFDVNPKSIQFGIHDQKPLPQQSHNIHVDSTLPLFSDPRLSNLPNFKYLPPKVDGNLLGHYPKFGNTQQLTYQSLKNELKTYDSWSKTLFVDPTSTENNLHCQFFERKNDKLQKLDIIDFGQHHTGDPTHPTAQVFFVGKVILNTVGVNCFMHMFTLIFD